MYCSKKLKKKKIIKLLSLFSLKKYFLFSFFFSLSGLSSFFLFPFHFFFPISLSSSLCFADQRPHLPKPHRRSILLDLHLHRRFVLGLSSVCAGFVSGDPSLPQRRPTPPTHLAQSFISLLT